MEVAGDKSRLHSTDRSLVERVENMEIVFLLIVFFCIVGMIVCHALKAVGREAKRFGDALVEESKGTQEQLNWEKFMQ
jgi:hypothetical protein